MATQKENIVLGQVTDNLKRPLVNLIVQVFDRDMRSVELLGESITDKEGRYEITWLHSQLTGRGRKQADIAVKVLTRKKKTLLYKSDMDAVRFNASTREEINITIESAIKPEEVEYDTILKEIRFLADEVAIAGLQENEQHRDITFLSRETQIPAEKIEHLVIAHRMQASSEIEAAFFYALLRKNTLLKNDLIKSFHARFVIDIHTDILPLLYDAALTDPEPIEIDVKTAVKEMIVSAKTAENCRQYMKQLQQYKDKAEEYYKNEHPRKMLDIISRFLLEDKISQMGKPLREKQNDLNDFFRKISDNSFFDSRETAAEAETSIDLGELLGFDETIISQVRELQKIEKPEDARKLAGLNKAGWKKVLAKYADEIHLAGKPIDKKMMDRHASSLVRKMEKEFPTAAFSAQLAREKKKNIILKNHKKIVEFLNRYQDFDLQHSNIDLYLKKKRLTARKNEAMRDELKTVQRIFKLVPHYGKTNGLLKQNIHSALSIAAIGETRFVKEIAPQAGINTKEAKVISKKAERINTAAMLMAGELQDTINGRMDIPALGMRLPAKKLRAVNKDFPNLKSLFKLADDCRCEHCRSVYSPAAYLVEILQFLDKRSVTDLSVTPHVTVNSAKTVLFERRPDLGEIDLGCENANTPVPYIDLVCELLEEAVAPDTGINYIGNLSDGADPLTGNISDSLLTALAGMTVTGQAKIFETETSRGSSKALPHYLRDKKAVCKIINTRENHYKVFRLRQTLSSAEELAAAPEYVNPRAYEKLERSKYAFKLPFDLNHTEAKAYFSRFDMERHVLMKDFQSAGNPTDGAIAAEKLGLTDAERKLIVTPDVAGQQQYWNTKTANASYEMKSVDTLLTKSGLTYKELDLLLSLKFIDPDDKLYIKHLDLSCDTAKKEIARLDEAALDRIHRFLRFQKKTGWEFEILDEIISQRKLGRGKLDNNKNSVGDRNDCLINASDLVTLSEKTGIKLGELTGCYEEIPHRTFNDDAHTPLYHQIFLNKARNGFIDEGLLPERVDGSRLLHSFKTSISICLQITEQDLDIHLLPLLPDDNLTFSNLSYLFAASRLMQGLKLKAEDFFILVQLTGINIQASPRATLDFVEAVKSAQTIPLKLADIQFMLHHKAANLADREIKEDKITQILEKIQSEYQNNFSANKNLFDVNLSAGEQKETLQNALSKLSGMGEEDVKILIKFIDKDWASADAAKAFTHEKLNSLFSTKLVKIKIDALAAAPGPDISNEQLDLVKAFLDAVTAYQLHLGRQSILEQIISSAFKTDLALVKIILKYAILKQPAPNTRLLSDILLSDTLIDADITHALPVLPVITSVAFADQYRAIRLLHKLFPLVNTFTLENQDIAWFLENNATLGWFEWDSIPYEAGQRPVDYAKYAAFAEITNLLKRLTPVANPADAGHSVTFLYLAEMLLPAGGTARSEFLEAFSLLTGYSKADVDAIDAHLFPIFNLRKYKDVKTWKSLINCAEHLRKSGSTVAQVKEYIKAVLTSADTTLLRTALKARYDQETWLSVLKEIMDAIRPQKRDALMSYLLAADPKIKDKNDLYDHFLVDVEMEACMPSSRIVQAHGTIQLFVQRCLMGLEPKAAADVNNDKNWNQWKWMKNYRVWEANRKVFLYPENWIEAELRDDKSFLFAELENELQQNELTEFTAEKALITYLEKLDNISFLEVTATWYQSDIKTMHVFARTKGGDPAVYYYRRFEQERYWTPWEKVELDISGDHLLAFVRNNRLSLAWLVFSEEADPKQRSKIPDTSTQEFEIEIDQPKRELKIQLAISEFVNNKWTPKKISKEAIGIPSGYGDYASMDQLKQNLTFFYNEFVQQIGIVKTVDTFNDEKEVGAFNLTGCKGYPELAAAIPLAGDVIPEFQYTTLINQRYKEIGLDISDALLVLSVHSILAGKPFDEILSKTPGLFRLTYPHQFTGIDKTISLISEVIHFRENKIILPMGTLLPYFMEDSNHAYVIVPGLYPFARDEIGSISQYIPTEKRGVTAGLKRTASDVLQLIEDIESLINEIKAYLTKPDKNQETRILNSYQKILAELKIYRNLNYGEQFKNMYHPLVCPLLTILYKQGIPALMKRETQLQITDFDFEENYSPNTAIVPKTYIVNTDGNKALSYPMEDLDFSSDSAYSGYNWELFFHVPFLLATRLTQNQRFEEALTWFHYMFDPTGALDGETPQKYWITKPFYLTHNRDYVSQRIDTLLYSIADPSSPAREELEDAVREWRKKPFKPHVIARFRPVAYQKALLMKYIDNLIEWGDYLFRQDTMESIAQATQMYILADKLLGPKPRVIPPAVKAAYETYNQIEAKIDGFGNALIDLENILPDLSRLPQGKEKLLPPPVTLSMLYFCIPQNDKMLEYWDRIADRLLKIRHCQNIDGVERSLALYAPPIDPGMLVRAAAAGLDISSILAGMNAPAPYYRFNVLSQKAAELAQEVRGLGNSLLQTLEKKDAEAMSLLRSELELKLMDAVKDTKLLQIKEAKEQIEILKRTKAVTTERHKYYSNIEKISSKEQLNLDKLSEAHNFQMASQICNTLAGVMSLLPNLESGLSGFGGTPHVTAEWGGVNLLQAARSAGDVLSIFSSIASYEANRASILGGYDRRFNDWKLQERLAKRELKSIEKQIVAAEIRKELAETDLKNHEMQIENTRKTDEFMRSKFTSKDLYDWMIGQVSSVYFKSYQLAHDFAQKAERSYRFELGNDDSFIKPGYWDSMKKGLQSADHLIHDIKRMETSYLDNNKRDYELTKHVSLSLLDPLALVKLRATGVCDFEIPEALYDMDHAGHYFRRIKSVSISLPCIVGPYMSVSAKLSLVSNKYRKNNAAGTGYAEDLGNDERFLYNIGSIQSIAASHSQNDSGIFELNFRDERYLPFEGTGAISSWRLELPEEVRQFDYTTISDLIMHVKYTAREGGSSLKGVAVNSLKERLDSMKQELNQTGLHLSVNMKQDLSNEWRLLKTNGEIDITIDTSRLPYMAQTLDTAIEKVLFIAKVTDNPPSFAISVDGTPIELAKINDEWKLCKGEKEDIDPDTPFKLSVNPAQLNNLENLMLVVKYLFLQ